MDAASLAVKLIVANLPKPKVGTFPYKVNTFPYIANIRWRDNNLWRDSPYKK